MSESLASRPHDRYERLMGRCGAILSLCLLAGLTSCSNQRAQETQAPPSSFEVQVPSSESSGSPSHRSAAPPSDSEPPRLHFPGASSRDSRRIGFHLEPLPGQDVPRIEFEAAIGKPLLLPEVSAGEYRLELTDAALWMETKWVSIQETRVPDLGDVFVYPAYSPCYFGARLGQDCFVFDATRAEVMRVGYRSSSGFSVWTDVQTKSDPAAFERIEHVHFRDVEEGPSAKIGEILVGPGTTEDWVQWAFTFAEQLHLESVRVVREPSPPPVESPAIRVVPKHSLGPYQARLFSRGPELGACFARHQIEQEIHVEVRFEGGIPQEVALSSGLPAPSIPSCSEYDEYMGRCSREPPPHPDALLNRAWLLCLEGELRALRVSGDETWGFVLRPQGSGSA